jgi:protein-S-isoprenylcysteine O-methyltransferase Ste14
MNGFVLIIPLILIRYLYLYILDKTALKRAAYIPLMIGKQKIAYWIYEFSSLFIIFTPCFLKIIVETSWFIFGLILYSIGVFLCFVSFTNFAKPTKNGINLNGLYKYSRNPIYVAYFIFFLGCSMITQSLLLLSILIIFQIATHFIILAEEKWCIEKFGEEYIHYMKKVRRYL